MQNIKNLIKTLRSEPSKIAVVSELPKLKLVEKKHPIEESIIIASEKSRGRKYFVYFKQKYAAEWTKAKEILHSRSDEEAKSHNIWWNFNHPEYIFSVVAV